MQEYDVIEAITLTELVNEVNQALSGGWTPHGDMQVACDSNGFAIAFYQPIVHAND